MRKEPRIRKSSTTMDVLRRMSKNKSAMIGLIIFAAEVILAIFAPLIAPYPYDQMDLTAMCRTPSWEHIMGTDDLGYDIFSRLLYGARYSISLGIFGIMFAMTVGIIIGAIAGYFGGAVDNVFMRFLDIIQSIPGILLSVTISASLGSGLINTIIALGIGGIPGAARMLRGSILSIRKMEYLEAADAINCTKFRTIVSHVLPNSISPSIVQATMGIANTILMAASLSFIGLGIQPPEPEWGAMLAAGRNFIRDYPHIVIFPGLAIAITVLALNMMGDGLRDALDPKLKD